MSARSDRDELLRKMVDADRAGNDRNERFRATGLERRDGPQLYHAGFARVEGGEHGWIHTPKRLLDDLREAGLVRVETQSFKRPAPVLRGSRSGMATKKQWLIDITDAGFGYVDALESAALRETQGVPGDAPSGLDWPSDVLPILEAAFGLIGGTTPGVGVAQADVNDRLGRDRGDPETGRVLAALESAGYITETISGDTAPGPRYFELTEKALQLLAAWPTGEAGALYEKLIALLDERVASASSAEERSGWVQVRRGVAAVGREAAVQFLVAIGRSAAGV